MKFLRNLAHKIRLDISGHKWRTSWIRDNGSISKGRVVISKLNGILQNRNEIFKIKIRIYPSIVKSTIISAADKLYLKLK